VKEKFRLDLTGKISSYKDSECCSFCLCVSGCIVDNIMTMMIMKIMLIMMTMMMKVPIIIKMVMMAILI
jgi:hypothetical protein